MSTPLQSTSRTMLRRSKERGVPDRQALYDVLRDGLFCHAGVVVDGVPLVLATAYGYDLTEPDGTLYLHGSIAGRLLTTALEQTICVTVTHADGLVLARSAFHHSVNYRSAVIFGRPRLVTDTEEKITGLNLILDQMVPGQSAVTRPPNRKELAKTALLALSMGEASVKVRGGEANDEPEDLDLPVWTGVIPLRVVASEPVTNSDCSLGVPSHIADRVTTLSTPVLYTPGDVDVDNYSGVVLGRDY
jgi:nitroimidazol reductase NimA-like FMN-containing flavoprotein (pyridoxamine 5'-phosphate oxidase superfamily)